MNETVIVTGAFDTPQPRKLDSRSCGGSISTTTTSTNYTGEIVTRRWGRCDTPGYLDILKRKGFLPYNSYLASTVTQTRIPGDLAEHFQKPDSCTLSPWTARQYGGTAGVYSLALSEPGVDPSVLAYCINAAIAEAKAAVMDLLTLIGEREQTVAMFRNALNRVTDYGVKAARRARRKPISERAKAFSSYWLEYRYGWRPLLLDLESALEVVRGGTARLFGRSSETINVNLSDSASVPNGPTETWTWTESLTGTYTVRGWAAAEANPLVSQRFGTDFLTTSWELLTFSFVIDWFIDVGSWLQALSPLQGGVVKGSGVSIRTSLVQERREMRSWHRAPGSTTNHWGAGDNGTYRVTTEAYQRITSGVSLPGFHPRLTVGRVADLVAIVLQRKARVIGSLFSR